MITEIEKLDERNEKRLRNQPLNPFVKLVVGVCDRAGGVGKKKDTDGSGSDRKEEVGCV